MKDWPNFDAICSDFGGAEIMEQRDEDLGIKSKEKKEVHYKEDETKFRHKCNPLKIFKMVEDEIKKPDWDVRFVEFEKTGFSNVLKISEWPGIPECFVTFVVNNFEGKAMHIRLSHNLVLKIRWEDVARVYKIPCGGKKIDLKACTQLQMDNLRKDMGLPYIENFKLVTQEELKQVLETAQSDIVWCKAAVLNILGNLLCPSNHYEISIKYAALLEDLDHLQDYDWCGHVLSHMEKGIKYKGFKSPKADFHFLMINYLERIGDNCQLGQGYIEGPTAQDWNTKQAGDYLKSLAKTIGLQNIIPYGSSLAESNLESTSKPKKQGEKKRKASGAKSVQKKGKSEGKEKRKKKKLKASSLDKNLQEEEIAGENPQEKMDDTTETGVDKLNNIDVAANEDGTGDDTADIYGTITKKYPRTRSRSKLNNKTSLNTKDSTPEVPGYLSMNKGYDEHEFDDILIMACEIEEKAKDTPNTQFWKNVAEYDNFIDGHIEAFKTPIKEQMPGSSSARVTKKLEDKFTEVTEKDIHLEFSPVLEVTTDVVQQYLVNETSVPIEIDSDVGEADDIIYDRTPEGYKQRRKRKKSKYVTSPYDIHVYEAKLEEDEKMMLTFLWTPDLPHHEQLYQNTSKTFPLTRRELWSLQENECVSSFVIDCYINMINLQHRTTNMKKLVMTVGSSLNQSELEKKKMSPADTFLKKMEVFKWLKWEDMDITKIEMIVMPSVTKFHFVTYVLNLKRQRMEFLTSMKECTIINKSGTTSVYYDIGSTLMIEAIEFVKGMYHHSGLLCPYNWADFTWDTPTIPEQPEGYSCGVFTMIFCKEWDGSGQQMESFQTWKAIRTPKRKKLTTMLRMKICLEIMDHSSNMLKKGMMNAAIDYCIAQEIELLKIAAEKKKAEVAKEKAIAMENKMHEKVPGRKKMAAKKKRNTKFSKS